MEAEIIVDIFNSDVFSATTMTNVINEMAYVPQVITSLDIFEVDGISTTSMIVQKRGDTLDLIQSSERGASGEAIKIDERNAVTFNAVHLKLEDKIKSEAIQNVISYANPLAPMPLEEVRDDRLLRMNRRHDFTREYHLLGAVQGLVLDRDNSVIYDLYDRFDIAQPAAAPLGLTDAWTADMGGVIKKKISNVIRSVRRSLGQNVPTGYLAFCGDDFFDALTNHPEVRETYKFQAEASEMRGDFTFGTFKYAGVQWLNYYGSGACEIATDNAQLIPLGVPEMFVQKFAPADTFAHVNKKGLIRYAFASLDPRTPPRFIDLETQSNPLTICTRPAALRTLHLGDA